MQCRYHLSVKIICLIATCLLLTLVMGTAASAMDKSWAPQTEEDLHISITKFEAWFREHYKHPSGATPPVSLRPTYDEMRMGVFATRRIQPEEVYLSIPISTVIVSESTVYQLPNNVGTEIKKAVEGVAQKNQRTQRTQLALCLFLIHETIVARSNSFFEPYLRLLPVEHDTPEFFTQEELKQLQGTLIEGKARWERQKHQTEYQALQAVLARMNVKWAAAVSYDHYAWAQGLLNTRMIWWDNEPHLVPMLDMINCRQGPSNPYRVHSTRRNPAQNRADTKAPWGFTEGEQVFENYGQPNPTYFLWHGFTMNPNVHDCAQVEVTDSSVPNRGPLRNALSKYQLFSNEFCLKPKISDPSWQKLLVMSRVVVMSDAELGNLKQAPHSFLSRVNEGKALSWMKRLVTTQLSRIAEGPISPAVVSNAHRRMMIERFREQQASLMKGVIQLLETTISPLRRKKKETKVQETNDDL